MRTIALQLLLIVAPGAMAQDAAQVPAVSQQFEADGIRAVVLRAGNATTGTTISSRYDVKAITVTAVPTGGAGGYHPPDANWKETKAADWGMSFVAERFGDTLVISSKNEISYIHHHYALQSINLTVPPRVSVQLAPRALSGRGDPDLSPP